MIQPERVLIACQGSGKEPFIKETEKLFKSLLYFGGNLAHAQKVACFTESISPEIVESLTNLGVIVKIVENLDNRCLHANKVQILDMYEEDYDYLVALDTDIVISRDFSDFLGKPAIAAKPVDNDPLNFNQWEDLFNYFDLKVPPERYTTCFALKQTIPYFNSGVLIIPKKYASTLYGTWKSFVYKLLDAYVELPEIAKNSFFTDQFALSLALTKEKLPYFELPLEMNFPTHIHIHDDFKPNLVNPYLIHYHHSYSSDDIAHCSYENINLLIDKINKAICH